MDQLGLPSISTINTTHHEFENALAKMTALMYRAGMNTRFFYYHSVMLISIIRGNQGRPDANNDVPTKEEGSNTCMKYM